MCKNVMIRRKQKLKLTAFSTSIRVPEGVVLVHHFLLLCCYAAMYGMWEYGLRFDLMRATAVSLYDIHEQRGSHQEPGMQAWRQACRTTYCLMWQHGTRLVIDRVISDQCYQSWPARRRRTAPSSHRWYLGEIWCHSSCTRRDEHTIRYSQ